MNNKILKIGLSIYVSLVIALPVLAQTERWQQKVSYQMEINMDVKSHQFTGTQNLVYSNNSPDTLFNVYYHLYFNAFQPGSMMDVRSRNISDPDPRVKDRIFKLKPEEIGYHKIQKLTQDGKEVEYKVDGTVLVVNLARPILPGAQSSFFMNFESQVPLQIRRSGRDNAEGIDFSMSQWYPKMAEYDYMGWHTDPYVGREFHGVWGDFDVKITIDPSYVIGGTGYLQNGDEIGHGYQSKGITTPKHNNPITWHFKAPKVMDFVWAADPDYEHITSQVPNGPLFHFFYVKSDKTQNWEKLPDLTVKAFEYINNRFGKYPYDQYSVIQGGDGGMEYPMATLITGERSIEGLVSVTVHELLHSWYQHLLGNNELLYAWMDEGFTSFASNETSNYLYGNQSTTPHEGYYQAYANFARSGKEEPSSVQADNFHTNGAYSMSAYVKGAVCLNQLSYIIGQETFDRAMLRYFNTWKFKHPNPNDFIRIMEKESGMVLDWYMNYWIQTTNYIDYSIKSVKKNGDKSTITLERIGHMPMPIDLIVTMKDGSKSMYYIPLVVMRNEKKEDRDMKWTTLPDWPWTNPEYSFDIPVNFTDIEKIEIDPTKRLADVVPENGQYTN